MIDIYLQSQAMLNGLVIITNVILFSSIVIGSGLLLRYFARRPNTGSTIKTLLKIVSAIVVFMGCAPILFLIGTYAYFYFEETFQKPIDVHLNLSGSQPTKDAFPPDKCRVGKFGTLSTVDCIFEGKVNFVGVFSEDRSVIQSGKLLWATGKDDKIESVKLLSVEYSAEDVYNVAKKLIETWNNPTDRIEEWHSKLQQGVTENFYYSTELDWDKPVAGGMDISIKKIDDPRDSAKPWFLSIDWRWNGKK